MLHTFPAKEGYELNYYELFRTNFTGSFVPMQIALHS